MAVPKTAKQLGELMLDAALAVGDTYHGGDADAQKLRIVAEAYSIAAAALQERADSLLSPIE